MKVTNHTSFKLIAFGAHAQRGYGEDVEILPGQTTEVHGPYLGEMGGGDCYVAIPGEITCHEASDSAAGLHVSQGNPLNLASGELGISVRHCDDAPDEYVLQCRERSY